MQGGQFKTFIVKTLRHNQRIYEELFTSIINSIPQNQLFAQLET